MADLATLTTAETTVTIKHPGTHEPIGVTVNVMHIDDPRLAKIKRQFTDEKNRLGQRGKFVKAEEIEHNTNTILFKAMTGWTWGQDGEGEEATFDGRKPDFTQKDVFEVLNRLPWFADQIGEAIGETEAFFTNSKRI